jgi:hypothetical protein
MNASRFFDIIASVVVVALVTTLILPGRTTTGVIRESSTGFSNILRTAQGR